MNFFKSFKIFEYLNSVKYYQYEMLDDGSIEPVIDDTVTPNQIVQYKGIGNKRFQRINADTDALTLGAGVTDSVYVVKQLLKNDSTYNVYFDSKYFKLIRHDYIFSDKELSADELQLLSDRYKEIMYERAIKYYQYRMLDDVSIEPVIDDNSTGRSNIAQYKPIANNKFNRFNNNADSTVFGVGVRRSNTVVNDLLKKDKTYIKYYNSTYFYFITYNYIFSDKELSADELQLLSDRYKKIMNERVLKYYQYRMLDDGSIEPVIDYSITPNQIAQYVSIDSGAHTYGRFNNKNDKTTFRGGVTDSATSVNVLLNNKYLNSRINKGKKLKEEAYKKYFNSLNFYFIRENYIFSNNELTADDLKLLSKRYKEIKSVRDLKLLGQSEKNLNTHLKTSNYTYTYQQYVSGTKLQYDFIITSSNNNKIIFEIDGLQHIKEPFYNLELKDFKIQLTRDIYKETSGKSEDNAKCVIRSSKFNNLNKLITLVDKIATEEFSNLLRYNDVYYDYTKEQLIELVLNRYRLGLINITDFKDFIIKKRALFEATKNISSQINLRFSQHILSMLNPREYEIEHNLSRDVIANITKEEIVEIYNLLTPYWQKLLKEEPNFKTFIEKGPKAQINK